MPIYKKIKIDKKARLIVWSRDYKIACLPKMTESHLALLRRI